tara:strand:- start:11184 stop:12158 length:975 start_codon:yes stop_codon:yes gene_type:complete
LSKNKYKLSKIANYLDGDLIGEPAKEIVEISSLREAKEGSISFIYNKKFLKELKLTEASAVLLPEEFKELCNVDCIVVKNPHVAYAKLTQLFNLKNRLNSLKDCSEKFLSSKDLKIGNNVFIGENVKIGKGATLNQGCFIGDNVEIGANSYLFPNVILYHSTLIGKDNIIHANSVIGSDGLGFAKKEDSWEKIEHLGNVELEDDVEIGAACTIDRGSLGTTLIKKGVKLDNQIHIAHNCTIGKNTIIGAKTAIAGSTLIGDDCLIGGGCGIVDNIEIESNVRINPMTYVTKSIKESGIYSGAGAVLEHSKWLRYIAIQKKNFND